MRSCIGFRRRPTLPGRVQPSTIGAEGLNFCVRDGNRWDPFAIATGNCIIFGGREVGLLRFYSVCSFGLAQGTVLFLWWEVFLFPDETAAFRLSFHPAFRAARPSGHAPRMSFPLRAPCASFPAGPLAHPDNCTVKRTNLVGTFFVSVLKSSPRPISIVKLHVLPHFHRRPITW